MKRTQENGINLYASYLQQVKKEQGGKSSKRTALILPLVLLAVVMLGISGRLLLNNMEKTRQLAALEDETAALSTAYDSAQSLEARRDETTETYEALSSARFLFELYPTLTEDLFAQVRDCAAGIFNISQYAYDETNGILIIHASAASVNEVPQFVQRLRDTELFSLVQYTGYTSEDTTEYFCTVGCTLLNENAYSFEELLSAEQENAAEDGAADTAGDVQVESDADVPG